MILHETYTQKLTGNSHNKVEVSNTENRDHSSSRIGVANLLVSDEE